MRHPTMQYSLRVLLESGVRVGSVLDVGVLTITQPLVEVFPYLTHHLFEPVDTHFDKIRNNYRNIEHVLHHVALSDEDGHMYLSCTSITNDGTITHSHLIDREVTRQEVPTLVTCKKVRRARLDTIMVETTAEKPYLIKIDVDGHELSVLAGADEVLQDASIVVIESPLNRAELPKFFERALYLLQRGFYLMDIVDLSYDDGILWQVDLIFVKKEIVESIDRLRPFQAENFSFTGSKWYALNDQKFK